MNDTFERLVGLGALKSWVAKHLPLFQENSPLSPQAMVLAGLPGTGKRSAAKAIAASIGKPLANHATGQTPDPATILLGEKHFLGSLVDVRHLGSSKNDDLARMTAWAARCATSARLT